MLSFLVLKTVSSLFLMKNVGFINEITEVVEAETINKNPVLFWLANDATLGLFAICKSAEQK